MEGLAFYDSPVGILEIRSEDDAITRVSFFEGEKEEEKSTPATEQCVEELEGYFQSRRKFFTLKLKPEGTPFQLQVWEELTKIPFGKTISYEAQAIALGNIKFIRAVGIANGQNPIAIIIPCHRVIGKDGTLVGYGGGVDRKRWLLEHEGAIRHQLALF